MAQHTVQLKRTRTIKETKLVTIEIDDDELPIDADESEEYVSKYIQDTIDEGNEPADWEIDNNNSWELDEEDVEAVSVGWLYRNRTEGYNRNGKATKGYNRNGKATKESYEIEDIPNHCVNILESAGIAPVYESKNGKLKAKFESLNSYHAAKALLFG